jgi:hypothetical protein
MDRVYLLLLVLSFLKKCGRRKINFKFGLSTEIFLCNLPYQTVE